MVGHTVGAASMEASSGWLRQGKVVCVEASSVNPVV